MQLFRSSEIEVETIKWTAGDGIDSETQNPNLFPSLFGLVVLRKFKTGDGEGVNTQKAA